MPYQSEYRRALYAARAYYERELREDLIQALYMEYAYTIEQIYADVLREAVSASRAGALTESIMRRLIELGERLGYTLDRSLYDAAGLAASAHAEGLERAVRATGVSVRASFTDVPHRAIEMMMVRRSVGGQARTFRTLINRRIEAMAPDVDRFLSSSIATGKSATRTAEELAAMLSRGDPALTEALSQLNISPLSRRIEATGEIADVGTYKQARSLLFDSYRIAVHETNSAYREGHFQAERESPVVKATRWTVSGRHWGLPTSPDVCSYYATADTNGLGPGIFHVDNAPALPHPFCQCASEPVLARPAEWGTFERGPAPSPNYATESDMRRALTALRSRSTARKPRNITDTVVRSQRRMVNDNMRAAHEAIRQAEIVI